MAGYSGTPLPQKLGIKPGARLALIDAPVGFEQVLGELPAGVRTAKRISSGLDVVVLFAPNRAALVKRFGAVAKAIAQNGAFWVAWPKKSSGVPTDLDENVVRAVGLERGLVDVKVCAIDETWSGLKFVIRVKDRS
jgi:hypothetical protein